MTLHAGPELDALVAEKVMGWHKVGNVLRWNGWMRTDYIGGFPPSLGKRKDDHVGPVPRYSTDIAAAWEVVEKLREMVASVRAGSLVITPYAYPQVSGDEWCVMHNYDGYDGRHDARWRVSAKTAPHAICLAALQALGSEGRTA